MATLEEKTFQQQLQRIETLIDDIETCGDPAVWARSKEAIQAILEMHSVGLERLLDLIWQAGPVGEALIHTTLAHDTLVGGMLLLHGLHPLDLETRVLQALEKVRPYLRSHGGNVELVGLADGVARLRLQGSCHGCPSSAMTLKLAIEEGLYAAAPDLVAIEVEGVVERPTKPQPNVIPLELGVGF